MLQAFESRLLHTARLGRMVAAISLSLLIFATPATAQAIPVQVSVDVVEAMKVFGDWVQKGFSTWDATKQKSVANAIPNVATELVALAVVKRQLAVSVNSLADGQPFSLETVEVQTADFKKYLNSLKRDLEAIDPDWRLKNIETTSALYKVKADRSMNESILARIVKSSSSGQNNVTGVISDLDMRRFADRQGAEADQLDALAKTLREIARQRAAK